MTHCVRLLQRLDDLSEIQSQVVLELRRRLRAPGREIPAAPLGMITLAALLPPSWDIRLVNRNTAELQDEDLAWADIVMTDGMLAQQFDSLKVIELAQSAGKPVAVGGPDPTSSPRIYARADIMMLGEDESIIDEFIAAWRRGERTGIFEAPKFQADVTKTPIPRFDLLKFKQYLYIGVQFSRGCPFLCEFCDIIELYGCGRRGGTGPPQRWQTLCVWAIVDRWRARQSAAVMAGLVAPAIRTRLALAD